MARVRVRAKVIRGGGGTGTCGHHHHHHHDGTHWSQRAPRPYTWTTDRANGDGNATTTSSAPANAVVVAAAAAAAAAAARHQPSSGTVVVRLLARRRDSVYWWRPSRNRAVAACRASVTGGCVWRRWGEFGGGVNSAERYDRWRGELSGGVRSAAVAEAVGMAWAVAGHKLGRCRSAVAGHEPKVLSRERTPRAVVLGTTAQPPPPPLSSYRMHFVRKLLLYRYYRYTVNCPWSLELAQSWSKT